ncbi:MAG: sensor histidine kinase [Anaerolineae bacterium]
MEQTWAQRDAIRVFRMILAVKLGFVVAGFLIQLAPGAALSGLDWPRMLARVLLAALAFLPWSERVLHRSLLAIVLGLDIFLEGVSSAVMPGGLLAILSGDVTVGEISADLVQQIPAQSYLLFLPTTLLAWGYGRRGALWGSTEAALLVLIGTALAGQSRLVTATYSLSVLMLLVMLYVVPLIVSLLAARERAQHAELEAAYDGLKRHAATLEQLAVSRERNRLARALHDTLAHSLSAIAVQLEALRTLVAHDPQAVEQRVVEMTGLARSGLAEVRHAIQELRSDPVQTMGLEGGLREMLSSLEARVGLETEMIVAGHAADLTLDEAGALYRIAEEALLNVERHARAGHVRLHLEQSGKSVRLGIVDDGRGFDPHDIPPDRYGLTGMRERAEIIGATLELDSAPGQGTRVWCTLAR